MSKKPVAVYFHLLKYHEKNLELLCKNFDVIMLNDPSELTQQQLQSCEVLFAPLGYYYGADIFNHSPVLKVIASNTTAVPHIDLELAASRQIEVISLKDQLEFLDTITATAEHTWGLLLALIRNLVPASRFVEAGNWGRWGYAGKAMLSNMHLGVVGLGRLGKMVAAYGRAFGMKVAFYDPNVEQIAGVDYCKTESLSELLRQSDVVSLHVHATDDNRDMFDSQVFRLFKQGAYFINTSRGELVDSESLIYALQQKWLAGAACDVLDGEYVPGFENRAAQHPLVQYAKDNDNLLITPHIAGSTQDAWFLTQRHTIQKVLELFRDSDIGRQKSA